MEYEICVTQTGDMFDKRIKEYMRPYLRSYAWYVGLPTVTLLGCLATGEFISSSAGTLILGLLLGCSLTQTALYAWQYRATVKAFLAQAEIWRDKVVVYEINDEAISTSSDFGRESYPWHCIKTLRAGPTDWCFWGPHTSQAVYVSADALSGEVRVFIKQKVAAAGGEIYNR